MHIYIYIPVLPEANAGAVGSKRRDVLAGKACYPLLPWVWVLLPSPCSLHAPWLIWAGGNESK